MARGRMGVLAWAIALIVVSLLAANLWSHRQDFVVHAAGRGDVGILKFLLGAGASASEPGTKGSFPLYAAAWWGRTEVVRVLLERGAPVNQPNGEGQTPLMAAASRGNDDAVALLIEKGANPSAIGSCGNALDLARANHHEEAVAILEAAGSKSAR